MAGRLLTSVLACWLWVGLAGVLALCAWKGRSRLAAITLLALAILVGAVVAFVRLHEVYGWRIWLLPALLLAWAIAFWWRLGFELHQWLGSPGVEERLARLKKWLLKDGDPLLGRWLAPFFAAFALQRRHEQPTLVEDLSRTFIAPLLARRHYDGVPDVMIYDWRDLASKPTRFPNGRRFEDDVARPLAEAGETLLLELSYTESVEFPRATRNDKAFSPAFPYLADPWTPREIAAATPGSPLPAALRGTQSPEGLIVPLAPIRDAIAAPMLAHPTWQKLCLLVSVPLALLTLGFIALACGWKKRLWLLLGGVMVLGLLSPISSPTSVPPPASASTAASPTTMPVSAPRRLRLLTARGVALVVLLPWFFYALGRRRGTLTRAAAVAPM